MLNQSADVILKDAISIGFDEIDISSQNHGGEMAFCITVYNEPLVFLKRTISSLIESLSNAELHSGVRASPTLCIIVDGVDKAGSGVPEWLSRISIKPTFIECGKDIAAYISIHSASHILRDCDVRASEGVCEVDMMVRVMVLIKARNSGKLHSHALFFKSVCPAIAPKYCFQIDVGTTIDPLAIGIIASEFDNDETIGACAPRILLESQGNRAPLIGAWQYVDFALQKAVAWPFESATGYLSVIPGQFCAFRWAALAGEGTGQSLGFEGEARGPIDAYLRGLTVHKPLEKAMFLAEDRVIGNEIVLRKGGNWRLHYSVKARATTDACLSIGELLRQRRRWSNSAAACRIWLFAQYRDYVGRYDKSLSEKLSFTVAMVAQFLLLIFEVTAPANCTSLILFLMSLIHTSGGGGATDALKGSLVVLAGAACAAAFFPNLFGARLPRFLRVTTFALLTLNAFLLAFCVLSPIEMIVLLVPSVLIYTAALMMPHIDKKETLSCLHAYTATTAFFSALINIYSMMRVDDFSWGTKGLVTGETGAMQSRRLHLRFRITAIAAWVVINLAAVAAALQHFPKPLDTINPLMFVNCVGCALIICIAFSNHIARELRDGRSRSGLANSNE